MSDEVDSQSLAQTFGNELFPKFNLAVEALKMCCGGKPRSNLPPIASSEVFNETWLLRLTLALLHDSDSPPSVRKDGDSENRIIKALQLIQKAVKRAWISEGGLEPAFENEGTTWTDAIIGSVRVSDDTSKRGVVINMGKRPSLEEGIIIVEAKMGSPLASRITNSVNYNQAARNIACLAKFVMEQDSTFVKNCAFIMFAPAAKLEGKRAWKHSPIDLIRDAWKVIDQQSSVLGRTPTWENAESVFKETVETIIDKSVAISWEEVIESLGDVDYRNRQKLEMFYREVCQEYGIEPGFQCPVTSQLACLKAQ